MEHGSAPGEKLAVVEEEGDGSTDDDLAHPLAVYAVRTLLGRPRACLAVLATLFCLSAWGALQLQALRRPPQFMQPDLELAREFPENTWQQDLLVIWCLGQPHTDCGQLEAEALAAGRLEGLRKVQPECGGLRWFSSSSPRPGASRAEYVAAGIRLIEIRSGSEVCMVEVRREFRRTAAAAEAGNATVALGGPASVAMASMDRAGEESWQHVMIAVPFIAFLLVLSLGNMFRPLTAIVCMAATFASTRAMLLVLKRLYHPLNIDMDDQAMFFIAYALNADYALFFWSRFAEERAKRPSAGQYSAAVEAAHLRAGAVIMSSNIVMSLAMLGTLLFPRLNTTGRLAFFFECLCGVVLAGVYSVTLTPALAALLPSIFDATTKPNIAGQLQDCFPDSKRFWVPWAGFITRQPWRYIAPALALAGIAPFLGALSQYEPNFDIIETCSNHYTPEYLAYQNIADNFNIGKVTPISVVLEARDLGPLPSSPPAPARVQPQLLAGAGGQRSLPQLLGAVVAAERRLGALGATPAEAASMLQLATARREGLRRLRTSPGRGRAAGREAPLGIALTDAFGRLTCTFIQRVLDDTRGHSYEIRAGNVFGIWWLPGLGANGSSGCVEVGAAGSSGRELTSFQQLQLLKQTQERTSLDGMMTKLSIYPTFLPTGTAAVGLSYLLRDHLEPSSRWTFVFDGRLYEFRARHTSLVADGIDSGREMAAAAPWIYCLVLVVGFLSVGVTFWSAFLPLKLALTVAVPLAATFGIVTATYQLGWFRFLGLGTVGKGLDQISLYTMPCALFGLSMDYDIFLFARVYEYRRKGYDNRSAVQRALVETGPVISTAGTLFAVSLCFLALSETPFLKYLGTVYLVGICLDVFLVRMTVAPAFLCMVESLNYWPAGMPSVRRSWGRSEKDGEDAAAELRLGKVL